MSMTTKAIPFVFLIISLCRGFGPRSLGKPVPSRLHVYASLDQVYWLPASPTPPPRKAAVLDFGEGALIRDDFAYLRDDASDQDCALYLANCQTHAELVRAAVAPLTESVARDLGGCGTDEAATTGNPLLWARYGAWEWSRDNKRGDFAVFLRRTPRVDGGGRIVLDANAVPVLLPSRYPGGPASVAAVRGLSGFEPEPSVGRWLAYTVDLVGDERYSLTVADVGAEKEGGEEEEDKGSRGAAAAAAATVPQAPRVLRGASVEGVDCFVAWGGAIEPDDPAPAPASAAAGSGSVARGHGFFLYYATVDGAGRPSRLWQRRVVSDGAGGALSSADRLLLDEPDPRFRLKFERNRAGSFAREE